MRHARIPIHESQLQQIASASLWLCAPDRDLFWATVARELETQEEVGPGSIHRAVALAFRAFFRPPIEADGQRAPRPLKKIGG